MPRPARRRFDLLDLMGLVAAVALGISTPVELPGSARPVHSWRSWWKDGGAPIGLAVSIVLVLAQFRPRRRVLGRLTRRPGFTAALATLASCGVLILGQLGQFLETWARMGPRNAYRAITLTRQIGWGLSMNAGGAVAAVWTALALGGRWRPERSWPDRLGLVLGLYWICRPLVRWLATISL
jgi:hypothetical protein